MDNKRQTPAQGQARRSAGAVATRPRPSASSRTKSGNRRPARSRPGAQTARKTQVRRRPEQRRRQEPVRKPKANRKPAPEVVYTPAAPFHRGRFLLRLVTVLAVVVSLVLGISVFFKVRTVTVSGAQKYSAWDVREASGIREGDNLLTFGKPKACGKIKTALPYVQSVRIGIKLPDTVNIEIEEAPVVYSIAAQDNTWWLMTAEGRIVEKVESSLAGEYTRIRGIQLSAPSVGEQAQAAQSIPATQETDPSAATQSITSDSQRLEAVLNILQNLEMNGMIGAVSEVIADNLMALELKYGQQYEVRLGDTSQLGYKIACLKQAVQQLEDYQSGVLDLSFTNRQDVIFTPAQ